MGALVTIGFFYQLQTCSSSSTEMHTLFHKEGSWLGYELSFSSSPVPGPLVFPPQALGSEFSREDRGLGITDFETGVSRKDPSQR